MRGVLGALAHLGLVRARSHRLSLRDLTSVVRITTTLVGGGRTRARRLGVAEPLKVLPIAGIVGHGVERCHVSEIDLPVRVFLCCRPATPDVVVCRTKD